MKRKTGSTWVRNLDGEKMVKIPQPDLVGASFGGQSLVDVNLAGLSLVGAKIDDVYFGGGSLKDADLSTSELTLTRFQDVDASGATFRGAELSGAVFEHTDLTNTEFSEAQFQSTTFINCPTLCKARGLEKVLHYSPSIIDAATLRACIRELPDSFLLGTGYTPDEISHLRDFYTSPIEYYSCFLSHGVPNSDFTDKLRTDLISKGISTWHYRYDMMPGQLMSSQIREAVRIKDKLVLVCSKDALSRQPVIDEILQAIEQTDKSGNQKLFPVRLDGYVISEELETLHEAKVATGEWKPWLSRVRAFWISDFSNWKDHDSYQSELSILIKALKYSKLS